MKVVYDREQFLMMCSIELPQNPVCCEVGVYEGDFSNQMFELLKPARLILIDPFQINKIHYSGDLKTATAYSTNENFLKVLERFPDGNKVGISCKYSYDAVNDWPDDFFHIIYHDASHLKDDLSRDLKQWLPKLKKGGLIAGHDFIQHDSFGVIEAVNEFCQENDFEMIIFNQNGGDYALKCRH